MEVEHSSDSLDAVADSFAGLADRLRSACGPQTSAQAFREELLRSEVELLGALYGAIWYPSEQPGKLDAVEMHAAVGPTAAEMWRAPLSDLAARVFNEKTQFTQQVSEPADRLLSGVAYMALALPVAGEAACVGVVTLVVREEEGMWRGRAAACAQVLANFGMLFDATRRQQEYQRYYEDISKVWDLVGAVLTFDHPEKMAHVLANKARAAFDVMRVTVGLHRHGAVTIKAVSDEDTFDKRGNYVRALKAAQEEAAAHAQAVVHDPPGGNEDAPLGEFPAHETLAHEGAFGGRIVSIPLRSEDEIVAVCTFECDADKPLGEDGMRLIQIAGGQIGPVLGIAVRGRWPVWRRAAESAKKLGGAILSVEHPHRRVLAVAAVIVLAFLVFGKATLRLRGECVLEPTFLRTYCAPFDATIKEVNAIPGDTITEGQDLLALDREEIELALREARSERVRVEREMDINLTRGKVPEYRVGAAERDKLGARIALLERRAEQAAIQAEFDGILLRGDLRQLIGSPVKTGDRLVEVAPLDELTLLIELPESDVAYVRVGQKGVFTTKARPDWHLAFEVEKIRPASEVRDKANVFVVEARVDNRKHLLRPGMEGVAKIDTEKANVTWVYARKLVDWFRMRLWW